MPKEPMSVDRLWSLPRVGTPAPLPDGAACIVPVTTYDVAANVGTTRLWRVPAVDGDGGDGNTAAPAPRPLTAADVSSSQPAASPDGLRIAFVRKPGRRRGRAARGERPSRMLRARRRRRSPASPTAPPASARSTSSG